MACPIEDYAIIGDCQSAALVSKGGSIDWLCVPRFDSPACFAALLGGAEQGRWLIAPSAPVRRVTRRYLGETLVLETVFETEHGSVALLDCLQLGTPFDNLHVLRIVEGRSGQVPMRTEVIVRFDYGHNVPWVTRRDHSWRFIAGPDTLELHTQVPLHGRDLTTQAEFSVAQGERVTFTLTYHPSHLSAAPIDDAYEALQKTRAQWTAWSQRSTYRGHYRSAVQRSLLVLKALTYEPTGGIVAAPTTSLPERLGGARNWDYRFCWLRDATITLYALLLAGYTAEAKAWREWLLRAAAGSPWQVQVIYGIAGERRLREDELPWLPGYADSKPVRIGNAAHTQLQLDVFGELMDAMHQCRKLGLASEESWELECSLLGFLETHWQEPDEGIWEVRGPRRHFTFSKVMAWVAFDRAVKAIEDFGCEGPLERFKQVRDTIHREVCERGWNEQKNSFVNEYGGTQLDASLLQIPLVGFLPAIDPRVRGTLQAIERELLVDGRYVLRYRSEAGIDGLAPGEGAFLACSFWLVSNYVLQNRREEATALFEHLLSIRNDVGLLSEEYDPQHCRQLGNFPQGFSHLALIDAAQALSEAPEKTPQHRVAPEPSTPPVGVELKP